MPRLGRQPEVGLELRACAACGKEFQPYRSHQIACSRPCRELTKDRSPRRTSYNLVCKVCGTEFTAIWTGMGRQPSCDSCTEEIERAATERKNAARRTEGGRPNVREVNRRQLLRYRYNLTSEQFDAMFAAQNGVCAICSEPADPNGVRAASRLHVDHDHVTGANRGLLCNRCNRGVGYFRDDPALLRAAAIYIEQHRRSAA